EKKFGLVSGVETQYYWPDLTNDMREILRVLKPGGTLLILAEVYRKGARNKMLRPAMKLLKAADMGVDDQRQLFLTAGFTEVQIFEELKKGWICVTGKRPV